MSTPTEPTPIDDIAQSRRAPVTDSSDDAIVSTTLEGIVLSWNAAAERLFGWTAAEMIGRSTSSIVPMERRTEADEALGRIRGGEPVDHLDTVRIDRDGRLVDVSITMSPVRDAAGRIVGAATIARNATDPRPLDLTRAWLAAVVDSSNDAIISKTLDGVITSWNAAAEGMFGYTAAEAVGQHITLIVPPDRHGEEQDVLSRVGRGERVHHFETIRRRKDGRLVDISLTVSPVRDHAGRIIGASKISRDITERRQAERAMATLVQRLEILYRLSSGVARAKDLDSLWEVVVDALMATGAARASVLSFDDAGVMRFRAWRNLSDGYRAAVEGHSPWGADVRAPEPVVVEDALADPRLAGLRDVIAAEGLGALAFIPLVSQGKLFGKFMIYYDAVHAFSGEEIRLAESIAQHAAFGVNRLLTDQAIEDLLERAQVARAEADAANRSKDRFLAVLSHELRTPLNAILGWARMLHGARLDDRQQAHAIEVIQRNADLQNQLIGDLLDISRIAAGKMEIERSPVDLGLSVREALDGVAADVAAKKLRLFVELDDAAGEVLGEPRRLQQVFLNLLSNAVKFTPEGGRVDVRLARHETSVRLTVADTGEGIDPAMLSRIFDPFEQANTTATPKHHGLGLGLAIVRQLVELHGGTIRAESEGIGTGATFTIDLPILAVRGARRADDVDGGRQQLGSDMVLHGCRVLVVDDQPDARDLLTFVLTGTGAEVRVAASGAEALRALAEHDVDVLVSDLAMPDLDGFALVHQARELGTPGQRPIRAVAVTAHMGRDVRARALAAGFDACVTKPLDPEDLVALLKGLR